ncbi:MAG: PLP-dependent aminotransferase family protein [Bacteroidales bacterium]|nr:PLP-dependent aminotransferase family protein [Bacteroidales bacterium]MBN2818289.1 PLP-dependent aminotransferase family protein [Bacteroidales bacterium]
MKNSESVYQTKFSERTKCVPRSFIRDILQTATSTGVISFAGGLPNKEFFPVQEIKESVNRVLLNSPHTALQYSNSEGFLPLREILSSQYQTDGIEVSPKNILITSGSQQALDLLGKVFINTNDKIIIEEPSYLGAIQAFSMYRPEFLPVNLGNDGINRESFEFLVSVADIKFAYLIPNFQNPSGISYSAERRKEIAEIAKQNNLLLIEDDPYGKISFNNQRKKSIYSYAPQNTILLGTFSKTVVPGFRLGWIVAPDAIIEKLLVAKQAADLHTDIFAQHLVCDFLSNNKLEDHLIKIRRAYALQAQEMMKSIRKFFPAEVQYTNPEGGMFLWMTLPDGLSSMELFKKTMKKKVAFVPGTPFYINRNDSNSLRLNFSCSNTDEIQEGISRMAVCVNEMLEQAKALIS